jgi:dihydrofolate synthase/folylpolyglutamate synthase
MVGMLATKDAAGFLRNFSGLARRLIAVPIADQAKALAPEALAEIARSVGIPAEATESVEAAIALIHRFALERPPRILLTGSLYLAGEILAANGTPPS